MEDMDPARKSRTFREVPAVVFKRVPKEGLVLLIPVALVFCGAPGADPPTACTSVPKFEKKPTVFTFDVLLFSRSSYPNFMAWLPLVQLNVSPYVYDGVLSVA